MEKQKTAYIYAACAILLWSTIASAFKITLPYYTDVLDLHILHLLFYASLISSFALFLNLLFSKKLNLLKSFSKNDYLYSALMGFLSPFLYYFILLNAYSTLTAQEAMTINWLWPMTLALLSIPSGTAVSTLIGSLPPRKLIRRYIRITARSEKHQI